MPSADDILLRKLALMIGHEVAQAVRNEFARLERPPLVAVAHKPRLPDPGQARVPHTASERFWSKVDKSGPCWLWTGNTKNGYGVFHASPRRPHVTAHRFAYEELVGPIPPGMVLMHTCDVRACVDPAHLRLGTARDNMADMVAKGRHNHGERCPSARLTEDHVRYIRASKESHMALARRFGVGPVAIKNVRARKTWKHVAEDT
jgi:hypothetical protein